MLEVLRAFHRDIPSLVAASEQCKFVNAAAVKGNLAGGCFNLDLDIVMSNYSEAFERFGVAAVVAVVGILLTGRCCVPCTSKVHSSRFWSRSHISEYDKEIGRISSYVPTRLYPWRVAQE